MNFCHVFAIRLWIAAAALSMGPLAFGAPPVNDNFADATDLGDAETASVLGTNREATSEFVEPSHSFRMAEKSIWWKWQAPRDGWFEVDARGSEIDSGLAVYSGSSVTRLYRETAGWGRVQFEAAAGREYRVAVDGINQDHTGREAGAIELELRPVPSPVPALNDDFADAITIGSVPHYEFTGNNTGATAEEGEPHPPSSYLAARRSLWWTFTPAQDGIYRVKLSEPADRYHGATVYEGDSFDTLVMAGENSGYLSVVAGRVYRIAVDSRLPGPFDLTVEALAPAANDSFANAIDLGDAEPVTFSAITVGAGKEPGEPPTMASYTADKTLWWSWRAPRDGFYSISSSADTQTYPPIGVYRGDTLETLVRADYVSPSRFYFAAAAGEEFKIVSGTDDRFAGEISVTIREQPFASNDDFADAIDLGRAVPLEFEAHNFGATVEKGEPIAPAIGTRFTVWWRWTAPRTASYRLVAFNGYDSIYRGDSLESLTEVSPWRFGAVEGEVFHFSVDSQGSEYQAFSVSLLELAPTDLINDDFADAVDLGSAFPVFGAGTAAGATVEPGEPPTEAGGGSIWWSWTAPETRSAFMELGDDSNVTIYIGDSLDELQEVASLHSGEDFAFAVTEGVRYHIRLDGVEDGGEIEFVIEGGPLTSADSFADAIDLGNGLTAGGSSGNVDATAEPGEPEHRPGVPSQRSIWWTWTAPLSGPMEVENIESHFGPAIYTGASVDSLTPVPVLKRSSSIFHEQPVVFEAEAGVQYYFADHSAAFGLEGVVTLQVRPAGDRADNDDFEERAALDEFPATFRGDAQAATRQPGEILHAGLDDQGGSLWWEFTPAVEAVYALRVVASGEYRPTFAAAVYSGESLESLEEVAAAINESEGEELTLTFPGEPGESYAIAIAGVPFQVSDVTLGFGDPFGHWMESRFADRLPPGQQGPDAEPRGDGYSNLAKFLFDLDPTLPAWMDPNRSNLPRLVRTPTHFELHYTITDIPLAPTMSHEGQVSPDGISWARVEPVPLGENRFKVSVPIEAATPTKLLRVALSP